MIPDAKKKKKISKSISNGVLFYLMFAVIFLKSVTDETFSDISFHFSDFTCTYEFRDKLIISNIP